MTNGRKASSLDRNYRGCNLIANTALNLFLFWKKKQALECLQQKANVKKGISYENVKPDLLLRITAG